MTIHLEINVTEPGLPYPFFLYWVGKLFRKGNNSRVLRRKSKFLPYFFSILAALIVVTVISIFTFKFINKKFFNANSVSALYSNWDLHTEEGYHKVYDIAGEILSANANHNTARTFYGLSAYMLSEYETDMLQSQYYLEEAINSLRIALIDCRQEAKPQLYYMLGKAYFYKNKAYSYNYYSDLVLKYLLEAQKLNYQADDMALLLGLTYASLGETEESIKSFTQALGTSNDDTLLFDIAKQYYYNGQGSTAAKQYLKQVISITKNEELSLNSHYILGQIYTDEGNYEAAENEYTLILEKNENSADAHYGLGVIYEKLGDSIKARSEWRKCIKLQPNHKEALKKLAEFK